MSPLVKNIVAVVVGFVIGSAVNMIIVTLGPRIVPPPEGVDLSTVEGLREGMKLFTPANFMVPLVAHALGTLVGAFLAAKIAATHRMVFALGIGAVFLLGGITAVAMIGGPIWFIACDLVLAYIPMAWLGGTLAGAGKPAAA